MALRRGFTGRNQVTRPKRTAKWGVGPKSEQQGISTTANTIWSAGVVQVTESQSTIVRIRGDLILFLVTAAATSDGFTGAVGIGLVTNEAFAIGATAIPNPETDSGWDGWMWHHFFNIFFPVFQVTVTADSDKPGPIYQRITIDSKAMRKWSIGYTLFGAIGTTESGIAVMELSADTRILVKLS